MRAKISKLRFLIYVLSIAFPIQVVAHEPSTLTIGTTTLAPEVRTSTENGVQFIDLQLALTEKSTGGLFVSDPFFSSEWPKFYAVRIIRADGEFPHELTLSSPMSPDGDIRGRELQPGEIVGRRFALHTISKAHADPIKCEFRLQLILFDGVAISERRRAALVPHASMSSGEIVASSELISIGEFNVDTQFRLDSLDSLDSIGRLPPRSISPRNGVPSQLSLKILGRERISSRDEDNRVQVVIFNVSPIVVSLFDPFQSTYGGVPSTMSYHISRSDSGEVLHYSEDGISSGASRSLGSRDSVIRVPAGGFCGRSQPWLQNSNSGEYILRVHLRKWIICMSDPRSTSIKWDNSSPEISTDTFKYLVE